MNHDVPSNRFNPTDVMFSLASPGAYTVSVVIFFNQWPEVLTFPGSAEDGHHPHSKDRVMARELVRLTEVSPGWWQGQVPLPPGSYEYLFLVDCEWVIDPEARVVHPDGTGGYTAVCQVEPAEESEEWIHPHKSWIHPRLNRSGEKAGHPDQVRPASDEEHDDRGDFRRAAAAHGKRGVGQERGPNR